MHAVSPDHAPLASEGRVWGVQHMLAGAVAGMAEHSAMYPVDTIKTRMQALGHPGQQVPSLRPDPPRPHPGWGRVLIRQAPQQQETDVGWW